MQTAPLLRDRVEIARFRLRVMTGPDAPERRMTRMTARADALPATTMTTTTIVRGAAPKRARAY